MRILNSLFDWFVILLIIFVLLVVPQAIERIL